MEKYEARTQQTDKGIHLQKGTGGQGEWLTQQPSAPHTHLSALVEQRLGEQKEGGRHHMAQEPVPVPSALLSGSQPQATTCMLSMQMGLPHALWVLSLGFRGEGHNSQVGRG